MKPQLKAAQLLSEGILACEQNDPSQLTIDRVQDIILELKTLKATEIKERIQYWQQVKDHIIPLKF